MHFLRTYQIILLNGDNAADVKTWWSWTPIYFQTLFFSNKCFSAMCFLLNTILAKSFRFFFIEISIAGNRTMNFECSLHWDATTTKILQYLLYLPFYFGLKWKNLKQIHTYFISVNVLNKHFLKLWMNNFLYNHKTIMTETVSTVELNKKLNLSLF